MEIQDNRKEINRFSKKSKSSYQSSLKSTLKLFTIKSVLEFTESDLKTIYEFYSSLTYFKSFAIMPNHILWKITCKLKIVFFKKGDIIYKYGDKSRHFYIILKGNVSYKMPNFDYTQINRDSIFEEIFQLNEGKAFGQYGILFKIDR